MIHLPKKSQSTIPLRCISVSALSILLSLVVSGCGGGKEQAVQPPVIPVKLKTVESATLVNSTEYVGTLQARDRVSLAPRTQGRILAIFAKEGDRVSRGQPIIKLEPTQEQENVNAATQTVNVEKSRLGQNQAELRTAEANRAAAVAEVESAKAQVQDIGSAVELAQINLDRTKMLVQGGALAQQELDNDNRQLKSSIARLKSQQETLNAVIKSLEAAEKQVEQAQANISTQNATIKRTEAELASTSQNLAFNTINAPIDGILGSFEQKKVGDYVSVGDELTTITNNQNFDLNINIPIENRDRLKLGLSVQTVNQDGSPGVAGKITYIAPLVQQTTQSILTKVVFPHQENLKDQEYVRVKVIWDEQPGILVPTTAISTLGGQDFVYLAKEKPSQSPESTGKQGSVSAQTSSPSLIAEQHSIKLGSIQAQDYQVISGLKQGDRIAVSNILNLRDGAAIQTVEAKQTVSEAVLKD
jgi:RND family efflux transporter MFP subunit